MSLLILNSTNRLAQLAQKVFDKQFYNDPILNSEYDEYRKALMLRDISYNLECLDTAIRCNAIDTKAFKG